MTGPRQPDDSSATAGQSRPEASYEHIDDDVCRSFQRSVEIVGKKWSAAVLLAAMRGARRFVDYRARIPGISNHLLSQRLRELEGHRLIERLVVPTTPVQMGPAMVAPKTVAPISYSSRMPAVPSLMSAAPAIRPARATTASPMPAHPGSGRSLVNGTVTAKGGLSVGRALLDLARAHEMGTVVGSMMETHLGVGAAASLAAACGTTALADLDAAWWAKESPFVGGLTYDGANVVLPETPGLGIEEIR